MLFYDKNYENIDIEKLKGYVRKFSGPQTQTL